jgi:hypothetical protein
MPEPIDQALRRAASDLAMMAPADRDWLLAQLSAAERAQLQAVLGPAQVGDAGKARAQFSDHLDSAMTFAHSTRSATWESRQRVLGALASATDDRWLLSRVVAVLPPEEKALATRYARLQPTNGAAEAAVPTRTLGAALLDAVDELSASLPEAVGQLPRPESLLRRLLRKVNG